MILEQIESKQNPLNDGFWIEEMRKLFSLLLGPLRRAIYNGINGGYAQIELTPGIADDQIEAFVRQYAFGAAAQITETSRRLSIEALLEWRQSGEPLDALVDRLTPIFGASRAEAIAVTEVTRAYAEGNLAAWRESGLVAGKRWMTAQDELVCPICSPLDNMIVALNSNGFTTEDDLGLTAPPAHVRCRCWLQPVVEGL